MASSNPFDLLGDDDNDDPSQLIAAQQQKLVNKKQQQQQTSDARVPAKLPTKPPPPAQAVKEARSNAAVARGGRGQGPRRGGRGAGFGQYRDVEKENTGGYSSGYGYGFGGVAGEGDAGKMLVRDHGTYGRPREAYRGGRRGGYANGEVGVDSERSRRMFERHSGTGRGNEIKREGSGRGNWGTQTDYVIAQETEEVMNTEDKAFSDEKQPEQDVSAPQAKDAVDNAIEVKEEEEEDKEMTLEEYEKIREEKRKALLAMKKKERKVDVDKELKSMQQLSMKGNDDIFIKLGSDKDSRKSKDNERDERTKKSVSINEFLKPADGERNYSSFGRGRGRGRGRGDRGPYRGGDSGGYAQVDIKIEDPGQFPALGGK